MKAPAKALPKKAAPRPADAPVVQIDDDSPLPQLPQEPAPAVPDLSDPNE